MAVDSPGGRFEHLCTCPSLDLAGTALLGVSAGL